MSNIVAFLRGYVRRQDTSDGKLKITIEGIWSVDNGFHETNEFSLQQIIDKSSDIATDLSGEYRGRFKIFDTTKHFLFMPSKEIIKTIDDTVTLTFTMNKEDGCVITGSGVNELIKCQVNFVKILQT